MFSLAKSSGMGTDELPMLPEALEMLSMVAPWGRTPLRNFL